MRELLEGAGPGVPRSVSTGALPSVNPSANGCWATMPRIWYSWSSFSILGPGEGSRMVARCQRLCDIERAVPSTSEARLKTYMECVRSLRPAIFRAFEVQLRRKDGEFDPGYAAHLRNARCLGYDHRPGGDCGRAKRTLRQDQRYANRRSATGSVREFE